VPATVFDKLLNPTGTANVGLTWGITLYFLQEGVYRMIESIKKEVNEKGAPLDKTKKIIKLDYTFGEDGYTDFD